MTAALKVHFDRDGQPRCGHGGKILSGQQAEVTCQRCLELLAGTYQVGRQIADPKPCGSMAAVRRHYRHDERLDETCRQAESRDSADRYARKMNGLAA